jgi:hypothetical protein
MTVSNTIFTIFSAIAFVLSIIPLWWHLESWNVGTCMFMIWTALACLVFFVDSIAWSGNTGNWAPVWCDIGTFRNPLVQNSSLTSSVQLFAFRLVLLSLGPLALFALSVAFTKSLPLLPFRPLGPMYVAKLIEFRNVRSTVFTESSRGGCRPIDITRNSSFGDGFG